MANHKRVFHAFLLNIFILIFSIILLAYFSYVNHQDRSELIKSEYIREAQLESLEIAHKVEQRINYLYQTIRTMSLLPGIINLDPYGKNISEDLHETIQQIYNNGYLNIKMSEIYFLRNELNPDKINLKTGKLDEPIITYDEFIVDKSSMSKSSESDVTLKIPEEEIFEYKIMQKQLEYFSKNYPSRSSFTELNIPMLSSEEAITCDNTEFSVEDFKKGDNTHRNGIIFTVPIYSKKGIFNGAVSAILRSSILRSDIPDGLFAIARTDGNVNALLSSNPVQSFKDSFKFFNKSQVNPDHLFSKIFVLNIPDGQMKWQLWVDYPNTKLKNLPAYKQEQKQFLMSLFSLFLIGIVVGLSFFKSYRDKVQLESRVAERMNEIEKLREASFQNEKLASLGEMAGGIAHEINNPMTIIGSTAHVMKRLLSTGVVEHEILLKHIEMINKTIIRVGKIVNGLKNLSRDSSSETFSPCNLSAILTDTYAVCEEKIKSKEIIFKCNLEDPVFLIDIDCLRIQLSQVFFNLIANSIDAIEGSSLPWIEISAQTLEERLIIRFSDSGNGIPMESQIKIFQPFYTTKAIGKGTGLGLSLCNSIIIRHDGVMTIDNDAKNTTFIINLPLKKV